MDPDSSSTRTTGDSDAWQRLAPAYRASELLEQPSLRMAVRLAEPTLHDSVVDLGCGTGAMARVLAGLPHPPASYLGIDSSPAMLQRMGELPAGWQALEGDATAHGLPGGTASLVSAAWLLHLLEPAERADVLAGMRHVLAPGGRAIVVVPAEPRALAERVLVAAGRAAVRVRGCRVRAFRTLDWLEQELRDAGLEPVRGARTSGGWPARIVLASAL